MYTCTLPCRKHILPGVLGGASQLFIAPRCRCYQPFYERFGYDLARDIIPKFIFGKQALSIAQRGRWWPEMWFKHLEHSIFSSRAAEPLFWPPVRESGRGLRDACRPTVHAGAPRKDLRALDLVGVKRPRLGLIKPGRKRRHRVGLELREAESRTRERQWAPFALKHNAHQLCCACTHD